METTVFEGQLLNGRQDFQLLCFGGRLHWGLTFVAVGKGFNLYSADGLQLGRIRARTSAIFILLTAYPTAEPILEVSRTTGQAPLSVSGIVACHHHGAGCVSRAGLEDLASTAPSCVVKVSQNPVQRDDQLDKYRSGFESTARRSPRARARSAR